MTKTDEKIRGTGNWVKSKFLDLSPGPEDCWKWVYCSEQLVAIPLIIPVNYQLLQQL